MFKAVQLDSSWVVGIVAALGAGTAHAANLNVPADFPTIQAAINAAVGGDHVVVADGIYNTDVDVLNKTITIRSASNNPALCVINCTGATGFFVAGLGDVAVVRGFTIQNGLRGIEVNADGSAWVDNCIIRNHTIGGMFMNGQTMILTNTKVRNNTAGSVGGGLNIIDGDVTIRNCEFTDNAVTGANAFGGGVHVGLGVSFLMIDSEVRGNTAIGTTLGRGGGLYAAGGTAPLTIATTVFDDNESSERGGGVYIEFRSATLAAVEITNNTALAGGGMFLENIGGAPNSYVVSNALITNNLATNGSGGGIRNAQDSTLTVTNATIMANTSTGFAGGGVANGPGSTATLTNCIVGGSTPDDFAGAGSTTVTYSNVEDGFTGVGNISTLPLFVDAAAGNYRLAANSPCIDAGNSLVLLAPGMDLDGNARIVDDPAHANAGLWLANAAIDLGAYEVQLVNTCPADIVVNDAVDVSDLLQVINTWGACP